MIIEIDIAAAQDQKQHRWLDRILAKVEDDWHAWNADPLDEDAFERTSYVAGRGTKGAEVMELFRASAKRAAWTRGPHRRRIRVGLTRQGNDDLFPEDAARLAEAKLVILVENRVSDGAFLKRVFALLNKPMLAIVERSARIDSVGGKGQMKAEVSTVARGTVRPRYVVVVDSDRRGPGDPPSTDAQRLACTCKDLGVPCWVLAKREAENYLPTSLLRARVDVSREYAARVELWDSLSEDQRDFFDMKDGLRDEPSASEARLFEGLCEKDRDILHCGFGPKVGDCWDDWQTEVTTRELLQRGRGDIERGMELLSSEV